MDGVQAACAADTGGVFGRVAAVPALSAEVGGKPAGQNKAPPPPLPADASQPPASSSSQPFHTHPPDCLDILGPLVSVQSPLSHLSERYVLPTEPRGFRRAHSRHRCHSCTQQGG